MRHDTLTGVGSGVVASSQTHSGAPLPVLIETVSTFLVLIGIMLVV